MEFMGANLRKISLRDGFAAAAFAAALTAGLWLALQTTGRDAWQALDATMPVFIGALASHAGVNPVRSPMLMGLVFAGAALVMALARLALGVPLN
jgi:predicted branched-subunit amino acid permease